jgi:hypothetical protein
MMRSALSHRKIIALKSPHVALPCLKRLFQISAGCMGFIESTGIGFQSATFELFYNRVHQDRIQVMPTF